MRSERLEITLPAELKRALERRAKADGQSLARVTRAALGAFCRESEWRDAEGAPEGGYYAFELDTYANLPMPFGVHRGPEYWEMFQGEEWLRWNPPKGARVFGPLPEDECKPSTLPRRARSPSGLP